MVSTSEAAFFCEEPVKPDGMEGQQSTVGKRDGEGP